MHGAVVLAHQGGWDEIVLVGVPVAVFGGLLALARRRAVKMAAAADAAEAAGSTESAD